ncbi:nudC domain-containing protein 3 isoform X2 [Sitophilus oryzae]|uniref:Nuclear migration protein nudC n=1 Tax=Sitophilus oryzae TaxID=7048 RepID=A0A6J2X4L5_SITOR|nr:nudC domain-containing protein 3 isoform X2 [Sitophilus oryzae]
MSFHKSFKAGMSEIESGNHDELLFNMLKDCKTLPKFFDSIFGFLQRRTDFYYTASHNDSYVGLPEGLAENLVKHLYNKWKPKCDDQIIFEENEIPIENEIILSNDATDNSLTEFSERSSCSLYLNSFSDCESYNGAVVNNYCWSQTISDIDVTIKLPNLFRYKDFKVKISTNHISVRLKDDILLEGELCQKCKYSNAIWSVDKGKLNIHLDKCKEIWWDRLITSENRLDITKLDCSRPFEDLPEDAQAKIEELGWNQERKRLGLPTSDDMAKQELLKKAWYAENSPFSGPFNPNEISIENADNI